MQRVDSLEKTLMLGGMGAGGEGDDRGWDDWMASPTRWTWVWVNSGSWWWTGRPGVLWFMGSQRVGHDWATELNWSMRSRSKPQPVLSWRRGPFTGSWDTDVWTVSPRSSLCTCYQPATSWIPVPGLCQADSLWGAAVPSPAPPSNIWSTWSFLRYPAGSTGIGVLQGQVHSCPLLFSLHPHRPHTPTSLQLQSTFSDSNSDPELKRTLETGSQFYLLLLLSGSVVSDSMQPHRQQPTRLCHPWDSPGKNTGVGCHFLVQCMKVKRESEVTQSRPTASNPMDCSLPGSSVHGIF